MVPLREKFLFCIIEKYNIYIIRGESHVIYLQARVFFFFFCVSMIRQTCYIVL